MGEGLWVGGYCTGGCDRCRKGKRGMVSELEKICAYTKVDKVLLS